MSFKKQINKLDFHLGIPFYNSFCRLKYQLPIGVDIIKNFQISEKHLLKYVYYHKDIPHSLDHLLGILCCDL